MDYNVSIEKKAIVLFKEIGIKQSENGNSSK